jgi:hypothetical protein
MQCSQSDGNEVFARGLCQACYWRLRRNGTLKRKNVVNKGKCVVDGCDRDSFARNLCTFHYQRAEHPLKATWKLLRSRAQGSYPASWDDFETFVREVGERPSPHHQLRRPDPDSPWSTENMVWREPLHDGKRKRTKEEAATYTRDWDLRKKYNLTRTEYEAMRKRQEDKCACCGNEETARNRMGQIRPLAIDHNHLTSAVRELACHRCNAIFGLADDDPGVLRAAIAYLERHAAPSMECVALDPPPTRA